jgi:hypothetical protein
MLSTKIEGCEHTAGYLADQLHAETYHANLCGLRLAPLS